MLVVWKRHKNKYDAENLRRSCTHCDQTFSNVGNLKRHVETQHEEKKFACTEPEHSKMLGTQHNLKCHINDLKTHGILKKI